MENDSDVVVGPSSCFFAVIFWMHYGWTFRCIPGGHLDAFPVSVKELAVCKLLD